MKDKSSYLVFDTPVPWIENFFELGGANHPALFIIMPVKDHWKLRGIPPKLASQMSVRHPFPEAWAGLQGEELKKVTMNKGAIFCHKGRFISIWETKEDAMQALQQILKENL